VLVRVWARQRRDRWEKEHKRLQVRLQPYLQRPGEEIQGQVLAAEVEQWLGGNHDQ
jgi:hypothetical protein